MASKFKFLTFNTRGLQTPIRSRRIQSFLFKSNSHIICLQETHLKQSVKPAFPLKHYPHQFYSPGTGKARGSAILIEQSCPFQPNLSKADPKGHFVFVKGKIGSRPLTVASISSEERGQAHTGH